MAFFNTNIQVDFRTFDLSVLATDFEQFLNNANVTYNSTVLPGVPAPFSASDVFQGWDTTTLPQDSEFLVEYLGENFVIDVNGTATGGTLTGLRTVEDLPGNPDSYTYLVGFSVALVDVQAAGSTATDNADDLVVLANMLSGDDTLLGSAADDYIFSGTGNDSVSGNDGSDSLDGQAGNDTLEGGAGLDELSGGDGNDAFYGGADNDTLRGGVGADSMYGGTGNDFIDYTSTDNLLINLTNSALNTGAEAAGDIYTDIENVSGGSGNDTIFGNTANNYLAGGFGNDVLHGETGNDTLIGSTGNDDFFGGANNDSIVGGVGNDTLNGGAGADQLDGGSGTRDMASYVGAAFGLRADLQVATFNSFDAAGDTYLGVEDLTGTGFRDTLLGDTGGNIIYGGDGNDVWLDGRLGTDTLYGGNGNDVLIGGQGADQLFGGNGTRDRAQYTDATTGLRADLQVPDFNTGFAAGDTYSGVEDLYGSFQGDTLLGDTGNNIIWGDAGSDIWLDGRLGDDTLYGGAGNDVLIGGQGADTLDGGDGIRDRAQYTDALGVRVDLQNSAANTGFAAGDTYIGIEDIFGSFRDDTLQGNSGANLIWGSVGYDVIDGRGGNDTILGGTGNDTITGGTGADVFIFESGLTATNRDTITDYTVVDDIIHLENAIFTALATTGALSAGAFTTGTGATAGSHRIIYNSGNGQLLYDADGNSGGAAIHFATISTGLVMTAGEFLVI